MHGHMNVKMTFYTYHRSDYKHIHIAEIADLVQWLSTGWTIKEGQKIISSPKRLAQCFPTFSTSRYPWPRSSYLTVPLEENIYFF